MWRTAPPYLPGQVPSHERLDWLHHQLVDKILERGSGNLGVALKRLFKKYDWDNSGKLEMPELVQAVREILSGYHDLEYEGLLARFARSHGGEYAIGDLAKALANPPDPQATTEATGSSSIPAADRPPVAPPARATGKHADQQTDRRGDRRPSSRAGSDLGSPVSSALESDFGSLLLDVPPRPPSSRSSRSGGGGQPRVQANRRPPANVSSNSPAASLPDFMEDDAIWDGRKAPSQTGGLEGGLAGRPPARAGGRRTGNAGHASNRPGDRLRQADRQAQAGRQAGRSDDNMSEASFTTDMVQNFWEGNQTERLYRFQAKLRSRLAYMYKDKVLSEKRLTRLTKGLESDLEAYIQTELRRLFTREAKRTGCQRDPDTGKLLIGFESFKAVLRRFRTPGQPFLKDADLQELWSLCGDGDFDLFVQVLYAHEETGPQRVEFAEARLRAEEELPLLHYPATKSSVCPPTGWSRDCKQLLRQSAKVPSSRLVLEHVYGFNAELGGRNAHACVVDGVQHVCFTVSAVVVVMNMDTKEQRFFLDHTDDVTALAVDQTGTLAASAQCASIDRQPDERAFRTDRRGSVSVPPYVLIWDIESLQALRRVDSHIVPKATIERAVSGLCFDFSSSHLLIIGEDDRHTLSIVDLMPETPVLVGDEAAQSGNPGAVGNVALASDMIARQHQASSVWVTTGPSSHVKFWVFRDASVLSGLEPGKQGGKQGAEAPQALTVIKGKFGRKLTPPRSLHAIAHIPGDDVSYTGGSDGAVYLWKKGDCVGKQQLHPTSSTVYSLEVESDGEHMWSGSSGNVTTQWAVDLANHTFTPLRTFDFGVESAGRMLRLGDARLKEVLVRPNTAQTGMSAARARPDSSASAQSQADRRGGRQGDARRVPYSATKPGLRKAGSGAAQLRKKYNPPASDEAPLPNNAVRNLVMLSGQDGDCLIACSSSGSFWRVDPDSEQAEMVHSYHRGTEVDEGVHGVAPHPGDTRLIASVGGDRLLGVWDVESHRLLRSRQLAGKGICLDWSPDGRTIAVGYRDGYLGVYMSDTMERILWKRPCAEDISVVKYSPNGKQLATGSHDNYVDLFNVHHPNKPYAHRKRLRGHSSFIVSLDWSQDSKLIQSNCGAHEIIHWDALKGNILRDSKDSTESDTVWHHWSCLFGFPVMGVWGEDWDSTDINSLHRSSDGKLIVAGDDFGTVNLYRAPCIVEHAPRRVYRGHCSHVSCVRFSSDDGKVYTAGGRDKALLQFRVEAVKPSGPLSGQKEETISGEEIVAPPPTKIRRAWTSQR